MTAEPPDNSKYLGRLDALSAYVAARDAETATPSGDTKTAADAAYARYAALRDQTELEAGS